MDKLKWKYQTDTVKIDDMATYLNSFKTHELETIIPFSRTHALVIHKVREKCECKLKTFGKTSRGKDVCSTCEGAIGAWIDSTKNL